MNSEEVSTIATEPFIQKFIFAIIQNIRAKNFVYEERQVIHADLVPKISTKVMQASLGERKVASTNKMQSIMDKKGASPNIPIVKAGSTHTPMLPPVRTQAYISPRAPPIQQIMPPMPPQGAQIEPGQDYGKITPLLNDPSISMIECQGAGKPLMIIRIGQRQITKIVLSAEDIKKILDKVSDVAHIPLLEGVFRAAVDNFSINAVISEMIGSKFIIKKQVTYAAPGIGGNR